MSKTKNKTKKTGRKTKLTKSVREQICKYIELGVPYKYAAIAVGITERTLYYWLSKGEEKNKGIYFQFFQDVKKAEAKNISRDLAIIEKAAQDGSWQAAAWKLERRHPDEFGKKLDARLEHSLKPDGEYLRKFLKESEKKKEDRDA